MTLFEEFFRLADACDDIEYKTASSESGLKLYLYIAGVNKENISISINSNLITVDAKGRLGYSEDWKFKNSWQVGREYDLENVTSSYENGVLVVNFPKKKSENVRKIVVA